MRSSWIRVASNPVVGVLIKKTAQGKGHVKMQAETGVTHPQAVECHGMPKPWRLEGARKDLTYGFQKKQGPVDT